MRVKVPAITSSTGSDNRYIHAGRIALGNDYAGAIRMWRKSQWAGSMWMVISVPVPKVSRSLCSISLAMAWA